jgi:hypothetical protein
VCTAHSGCHGPEGPSGQHGSSLLSWPLAPLALTPPLHPQHTVTPVAHSTQWSPAQQHGPRVWSGPLGRPIIFRAKARPPAGLRARARPPAGFRGPQLLTLSLLGRDTCWHGCSFMGSTCCRGVPGAGVADPLLLLVLTGGSGESASCGVACTSRK